MANWFSSLFQNTGGEKKSPPQGLPEIHSLTYDDVEKFLCNARACLNKEQAPLLTQGMQVAFFPIQQAVGEELGFGDAMRRYAELTKQNPDQRLKTLLTLKLKDPAVEAGYLYIVALLTINYGHFGILPALKQGNMLLRSMELTEIATCILEERAQYS